MSDRRLLDRSRAGDLDAFAVLVRRHEGRVRAVVARLLDDGRDVEDATQDTFVKAWRGLTGFRGDAAPSTWLHRIAVNEALMRLRRPRPRLIELSDAHAAAALDPPRPIGDPEAVRRDHDVRAFLLDRVRRLPWDQRAAVVLRDIEGLSNQQVADLLALSLAATKSRVHRGRLRLRAELEAWERG